MLYDTGTLMSVNDVYLLSDKNLSNQRKRVEEAKESAVTLYYRNVRQVVDL